MDCLGWYSWSASWLMNYDHETKNSVGFTKTLPAKKTLCVNNNCHIIQKQKFFNQLWWSHLTNCNLYIIQCFGHYIYLLFQVSFIIAGNLQEISNWTLYLMQKGMYLTNLSITGRMWQRQICLILLLKILNWKSISPKKQLNIPTTNNKIKIPKPEIPFLGAIPTIYFPWNELLSTVCSHLLNLEFVALNGLYWNSILLLFASSPLEIVNLMHIENDEFKLNLKILKKDKFISTKKKYWQKNQTKIKKEKSMMLRRIIQWLILMVSKPIWGYFIPGG